MHNHVGPAEYLVTAHFSLMGVDPRLTTHSCLLLPSWLQLCEKFRVNASQTALSMIRIRLADKLLVYVASLKLAKEALETLKGLLEAQGLLGIVLAWWKLFQAKYDDGASIEDHIRTLRGYQEELHNLRHKIKDAEVSIIILTLLPDSWNNYILSINSSVLKEVLQLIARILEHNRWLKIQGTDDSALAAKWGKKKYNPKIICYGCSKHEHVQEDCQSKSNNQSNEKHQKKPKFRGACTNQVTCRG